MEAAAIEIPVISAKGKSVGTKQIRPGFFAAKVSPHLLHQYSRWQRNKQRAGTHSVLTRAEARGGGAKPWKQKGTGRARAGSNTSPLWVGGGIAHGPKQRSYAFSINKKERAQALAMAYKDRFDAGCFLVVDTFGLKKVSTKNAQQALKSLGIERGVKALLVVADSDQTTKMSLRNIAGIKVISPNGINVYDILNHRFLVVVGDAIDQLQLGKQGTKQSVASEEAA